MAAALPVRPGDLIGDRYRVERVIGQGGMALVVAAIDIRLEERVAVKILLPERATSPEACARFTREARTAVKIKNAHVVRVTDVGALANGTPFMVMEYLDGEDLASLLRRKGSVPATTAMFYMLQVCSALKEAHGLGIVHRDLKPANLFLVKIAGQPPALKILDFGISKIENTDRRRTETKEILGSPWYMAPEQLKKASAADARSDIWSLGIILHELVTGKVPFDGESMTEIIVKVLHEEPIISGLQRELPSRLEAVIRRCLSKDPEDRFASADDLAAGLQSADAGVEMPPISEPDLPPLASAEDNDDAETVDPSELLPFRSQNALPDDDDDEDAEVVDPSEVLLSSMMPPAAAVVRDSEVELVASPSASVAAAVDALDALDARDVRDSDVEMLPASQPSQKPPPVEPKPPVEEEAAEAPPDSIDPESIEMLPPSEPVPAVDAVPEDEQTTEIAPPVASVRRSKQPPSEAPARTASIPPASSAAAPQPKAPKSSRTLVLIAIGVAVAVVIAVKFWNSEPPAPQPVVTTPPSPSIEPSSAPSSAATEEPGPSIIEADAPRIIPSAAPSHSVAVKIQPTTQGSEMAAPPPVPRPTASAEPKPAASAKEEDDDATIAYALVRAHQATLRSECWDASDKTTSVVNVSAEVQSTGAVSSATATAPDAKLAQCVQGQVASWTFPSSKKTRTVAFPVRFRR